MVSKVKKNVSKEMKVEQVSTSTKTQVKKLKENDNEAYLCTAMEDMTLRPQSTKSIISLGSILPVKTDFDERSTTIMRAAIFSDTKSSQKCHFTALFHVKDDNDDHCTSFDGVSMVREIRRDRDPDLLAAITLLFLSQCVVSHERR